MQDDSGNIIIRTAKGTSKSADKIPKRGDNYDVQEYINSGANTRAINSNNTNVVNNDSDGSSSDSDDSSAESDAESSETSESSDSSNSFSGGSSDDSEIDIGVIDNKKSKKSTKISRKRLRKLLKKDKNKLKSKKYVYKLAREVLESHPRWPILSQVIQSDCKLSESNYWSSFKKVKLAEIPGLLPRCIITMVRRRATALKDCTTTVRDLRAVEKFMDKTLVHTTDDISTAATEFINQIKGGTSPNKALKRVKPYWLSYRTAGGNNSGYNNNPGYNNNNNYNNNNKNKRFAQKLCRDFNFNQNGCARPRCKFYSGHICCYCGYKNHGLRTCNSVPNMVIGKTPNLPAQPVPR